ncbi:hypothetical protein [Deinococcus sp.]|uniref:hypothetical protein n=1 Tax=Deinococcus sp. TaxID=47478 RepID=UPI0025FE8A62|nr:hypothetical protein [Deinococcus sp.]
MRARKAARLSVRLALLVGFASVGVWASPAPTPAAPGVLQISFSSVPGLLYNREGGSSLTITSPLGKREYKLGGVTDVRDNHYWSSLTPLRLRLAADGGRVKLHTRLYVCDQAAGLCSVRQHEQSVDLVAGGVTKVSLPTDGPPTPKNCNGTFITPASSRRTVDSAQLAQLKQIPRVGRGFAPHLSSKAGPER